MRFPLRTAEQASPLGRAWDADDVLRLFDELVAGPPPTLFLHAVHEVACLVWRAGAPAPEPRARLTLRGDLAARRACADFLKVTVCARVSVQANLPAPDSTALHQLLARTPPSAVPRRSAQLQAVCERWSPAGMHVTEQPWWLRVGVGTGAAWQCARKGTGLWPAAGVACTAGPVAGVVYAGMPTPMRSGYPVHVSARWALADNRATVLCDGAASHADQRRWNLALAGDAVAGLWAELLLDMRAAGLARAYCCVCCFFICCGRLPFVAPG